MGVLGLLVKDKASASQILAHLTFSELGETPPLTSTRKRVTNPGELLC